MAYANDIEARLSRMEAKLDQLLNQQLVSSPADIDAQFDLGRRAGKSTKEILAEINRKLEAKQ